MLRSPSVDAGVAATQQASRPAATMTRRSRGWRDRAAIEEPPRDVSVDEKAQALAPERGVGLVPGGFQALPPRGVVDLEVAGEPVVEPQDGAAAVRGRGGEIGELIGGWIGALPRLVAGAAQDLAEVEPRAAAEVTEAPAADLSGAQVERI